MAIPRTLAALLAGGAGLATLAATQSPGAAATAEVDDFELKAVIQSQKDLDTGRDGESAGDRFVFTEKLFDVDDGDRVGTSSVECLLTWVKRNDNGRIVNGAGHCSGVLILRDGQITLEGGFTFKDQRETTHVAITGGTEDYAGATGEMRVRDINSKASRMVLDFDDDSGDDGSIVGPIT